MNVLVQCSEAVCGCIRTCSVVACLAVVACTHQPPAPTVVDRLEEVEAQVEEIDLVERVVTLRCADGTALTTQVGEEVRNLDQVKVGDRVVVRYYEAVGAEFAGTESQTSRAGDAAFLGARAAPGERPAAALASAERSTVTIDSVDASRNTVAFAGEDGILRRLRVFDPDAQRFIRALRKGDQVTVTYVEAYAVSVEATD